MFILRSLFLTAIYLILVSNNCDGQQFIGCVGDGNLYTIDILGNNCNARPITRCSQLRSFSIGIYRDSIYSVQIDSLMCSSLTSTGAGACRYVMRVPAFMNALTSDSTGILYGASEDSIFRINPATRTFNFLGRMPFLSAGDLFFFQGKLYLSSSFPNAGIVEVNINNPQQSIMVLPVSNYNLFGLVSIPSDCSHNIIFGLASTQDNYTTILEIDMLALQIVSVRCTLPFVVNDAASITETGVTAGIGIQSIITYPECSNSPSSGSLQVNIRGAITGSIYQYTVNGSTNNTGVFSNLAAGVYNIHISAAGGCVMDTFATVGFAGVPDVRIITISDTCTLGVGRLFASASGGRNPYTFQVDTTIQSTGLFSNLTAGLHQLQLQDSNRCVVVQNFIIENVPEPSPNISFTVTSPDCYNRNNGSILLAISGVRNPYYVSIAGGAYTQQSSFPNLAAGNLSIKVKDFQGCVTDTTAIVPQYIVNRPLVVVDSASPSCFQPTTGFIQLTVTGSDTYYASYLNTRYPLNYRFSNLQQGNYFLNVVDSVNCVLYSVNIPLHKIYMPGCNTIYVPTAFTPNSDGNNDLFKATVYGTLLQFSLSIYNRFGNLVFKSSDSSKGWNGEYKGLLQPSGSFVWTIDYVFEGEKAQQQKGNVVLIR